MRNEQTSELQKWSALMLSTVDIKSKYLFSTLLKKFFSSRVLISVVFSRPHCSISFMIGLNLIANVNAVITATQNTIHIAVSVH